MDAVFRLVPHARLRAVDHCIDHYARVLAQFPEAERQEMADEEGIIQVDCAFCSRLFPVPLAEIATRH